jgi:hypothetical protein
MVHAFITSQYNQSLYVLASVGFIVSSTETLALQLLLPRVDEQMGSIFFLFLADDHPIRKLAQRIP